MKDVFEENRLYKPTDKEMRLFGSVDLLNQWRHRHHGPAYINLGRSVAYLGADLNKYLRSRRVDPSARFTEPADTSQKPSK